MHTDTDTDVNTDTVTGTHIIHILRIIRNWQQIRLHAHMHTHIQVPRFPKPYPILENPRESSLEYSPDDRAKW